MIIEEWKEIEGFEEYHISNLGRVKSFKRYTEGKIMSLNMTKQGYYHVIFYSNKILKGMKVHRLVASAFIPNPENKPQVNHIDGNKYNNVVSNLEWSTASENQFHAIELGLSTSSKGNKHGRSKLTEELVIDILERGKWSSYETIAKSYGVDRKTIEDILKRKKWKHIEGFEPVKSDKSSNYSCKLKKEDVEYIRNSSDSNSYLAIKFNVDVETIRSCKKFITYKDV